MYIYLFTDIEADGPVPGLYSMLSFASVARSEEGEELGEFERNLLPLPGATQHPSTMAWWSTQSEAWDYCRTSPKPPKQVMEEYATWVESLGGKPVMAAHPASFDSMWMHYYSHAFLGRGVFPNEVLDLLSYAMATLGNSFLESGRKAWPSAWLGGYDHSHKALDDARGYANAFFELKRLNDSRSQVNLIKIGS